MSEELNKQREESSKLRESTFACTHCGSGAENFLTLFKEGTCSRCGAPAGVVVETSRPEDMEKIQQSVVLVAPEEEKENARQVMKELTEQGINVIDPEVVVENEQAGNRAEVLAFLVDKSKYVLVIPPKVGKFSEDRLVSAAVEQSISSDKSNLIPLYPDASYKGRSSLLDTRMGVQWKGSPERAWDKDRFLDHLSSGREE